MGALVTVFTFLATHADLIQAVWQAIEGGAKKEDILAAIRQAQIDATKAAVEADLGPRP